MNFNFKQGKKHANKQQVKKTYHVVFWFLKL